MMKKINKEIINYFVFGILTTLVNYVVYFTGINIFKVNYLYSNIIAWIISVIFAYITNKLFVFKKTSFFLKTIVKELILFINSRLLSGIIETGLLYIFVEILNENEKIIKILVSIIVVILNYYFSKKIIFKK